MFSFLSLVIRNEVLWNFVYTLSTKPLTKNTLKNSFKVNLCLIKCLEDDYKKSSIKDVKKSSLNTHEYVSLFGKLWCQICL